MAQKYDNPLAESSNINAGRKSGGFSYDIKQLKCEEALDGINQWTFFIYDIIEKWKAAY